MTMRSQRGYTLVELGVTVTVVATLLVIAVPNFLTMLRGQQIKNAALDVASVVTFARSEAVKRNTLVNVSAANAGWNGGWVVAPASAASTTIGSHDALNGITISEAGGNTQFQFGGNGRMQQPLNLKFTVAPATTTAHVQPLCINVGSSGRTQTTTGACS
jgi:type IV fimbrial biogenesis protein FimT